MGYHLIIDSVHFLTEKIPGGYSLTFALDLHVSHHFREFLYFFIMTFSCFESTSFASGALLRPIELACECELLSLPLSRVPMARHAGSFLSAVATIRLRKEPNPSLCRYSPHLHLTQKNCLDLHQELLEKQIQNMGESETGPLLPFVGQQNPSINEGTDYLDPNIASGEMSHPTQWPAPKESGESITDVPRQNIAFGS